MRRRRRNRGRKPPEAQTAKAPDRKETDKPKEKQANKPKSDEKEFNADEVAALLNKEKAAGGGAKRSTDEAALGGEKTTGGEKLSQSEMDALRGQVQRLLDISRPAPSTPRTSRSRSSSGSTRNGELEGSPEIVDRRRHSGSSTKAPCEAARRAECRPQRPYNLPDRKYEIWAEVIVHFDPSEMF